MRRDMRVSEDIILQKEIIPFLLNDEGDYLRYIQQDGAPPHYGNQVRRY